MVVNVFEAVDVITILKGGAYEELNLSVGEALQKRSEVSLHQSPSALPVTNAMPRTFQAYTLVRLTTVSILSSIPSASPASIVLS